MKKKFMISLLSLSLLWAAGCSNQSATNEKDTEAAAKKKEVELLNVSYDPTREFYEEFNKSFAAYWEKEKSFEPYMKDEVRSGLQKQWKRAVKAAQAWAEE